MAFTWRVTAGADSTITSAATAAADWLAAMNTNLVTNSGGAGAQWEAVEYIAVSPRSLLLRRKNGNPGRIIFFGQGGSTAHASAVRAATSGHLYVGYSPTSTSNVVDGSWLTGAPLTATDYMPGVSCWPISTGSPPVSGTGRMRYAEFADGIYFLAGMIVDGFSDGFAIAGAGLIVQDASATVKHGILGSGIREGGGAGRWPNDIWTSNRNLIESTVGLDNSYSTSFPGLVVKLPTTARASTTLSETNVLLFRQCQMDALVPSKFRNTVLTRVLFWPIELVGYTGGPFFTFGKLRQVCFGPKSTREASLTDVDLGSIGAYAHSFSIASENNAIWFVNSDV